MGNLRFGKLPRTKLWDDVGHRLKDKKDPLDVALAALRASEGRLLKTLDDQGLHHSFDFLLESIFELQQPTYFEPSPNKPLKLTNNASFIDLTSFLSRQLNTKLEHLETRTDVSDMASLAMTETITAIVRYNQKALTETSALKAQEAIHKFCSENGPTGVSREFIARFLSRYISYFLSKELPVHIGEGRRFAYVQDYSDFSGKIKSALHSHIHACIKGSKDWNHWDGVSSHQRSYEFSKSLFKFSLTQIFEHTPPGSRHE